MACMNSKVCIVCYYGVKEIDMFKSTHHNSTKHLIVFKV